MSEKLTKARAKVLRYLDTRPLDIHDMAEKMGLSHDVIFIEFNHLKAAGLIDWVYSEDAASLTDAGRAVLSEQNP